MPLPVVLLAFANDWANDRQYLRSLLEENKLLGQILDLQVSSGRLRLLSRQNATVDDILESFQSCRDQIRVFHFGGHAGSTQLLFEDAGGSPRGADAATLAGYLGQQERLVLVFLNGCCTEPQVKRLREVGVKAVVATTAAIQDGIAAQFAAAFYTELVVRSLREAFEAAERTIRLRYGNDPRDVRRDADKPEVIEPPGWPWILECDPAFEAWSLGTEIEISQRAKLRRGLALVTASLAGLLSLSLAASSESRSVLCRRVPGLRSLCAAMGFGKVPSAAEQSRWSTAISQESGEGLRAYLRAYPEGAYADEARARLAGCKLERAEILGPAKEARHKWAVNPNRAAPLSSEEAARLDALARGYEDARGLCKSYERIGKLLLATPQPRLWSCLPLIGGYACGFDGEISCLVQDRIPMEVERCRGDPR